MAEGMSREGEISRIGIPMTVTFPALMYEALADHAEREGISEDSVVRVAVEVFLKLTEEVESN